MDFRRAFEKFELILLINGANLFTDQRRIAFASWLFQCLRTSGIIFHISLSIYHLAHVKSACLLLNTVLQSIISLSSNAIFVYERAEIRQELNYMFSELTHERRAKLRKKLFRNVVLWTYGLAYVTVMFSIEFFNHYKTRIAKFLDTTNEAILFSMATWKTIDAALWKTGWVSSNLMMVSFVYEVYEEYDSTVLEKIAFRLPNQRNSRPDHPEENLDDRDTSTLIHNQQSVGQNRESSGRNSYIQLDQPELREVLNTLRKLSNQKVKVYNLISIFPFFYFAQEFIGTIFRLILFTRKGKEDIVRIFCLYVFYMSFIVMTTYIAHRVREAQNVRYKSHIEMFNSVECDEFTHLKKLIMEEYDNLKNVKPKVWMLFNLDLNFLLRFYENTLPLTVYFQDLILCDAG